MNTYSTGESPTIKNNKFKLAPNCLDAVVNLGLSKGNATVVNNSFEGNGAACLTLQWGT